MTKLHIPLLKSFYCGEYHFTNIMLERLKKEIENRDAANIYAMFTLDVCVCVLPQHHRQTQGWVQTHSVRLCLRFH